MISLHLHAFLLETCLRYLVPGLSWDPKDRELEAHHPVFSCLGESLELWASVYYQSGQQKEHPVVGEGEEGGEDIYSFRYSFIPWGNNGVPSL